MAYLTSQDYDTQIKQSNLDQILDGSSTTLTEAELSAEAKINNYLGHRYNMAEEFSRSGTGRNADIVEHYINLVLYRIHKRISPNNVPVHINNSYLDSIRWLEMVGTGRLTAKLPEYATSQGSRISYGGNDKLNHYY